MTAMSWAVTLIVAGWVCAVVLIVDTVRFPGGLSVPVVRGLWSAAGALAAAGGVLAVLAGP